ncbi:MAG: alpha/beta hydrolase [Acidobacteriota bacterium]
MVNEATAYRFSLDHIAPELRETVRRIPPVRFESVRRARFGIALMHFLTPRVDTSGTVITTQEIRSGDGRRRIRLRLYTPAAPAGGPRPAMVFMHWGGFVVGGLETEHDRCVRLCRDFGMVIVSVDYRLAPENPFPLGLDDCFDALCWVHDHATRLGVDPASIAVGGTSAGGGLAAALALKARDGGGPVIAWQYLGFPVLDDSCSTSSARRFVDTPNWTAPANRLMWSYYLGGREATALAAPARAKSLKGLPPAYLWTAEFDPLHDEGVAYAHRLEEDGVAVTHHDYPGTVHGFDSLRIEQGVVARARADQARALPLLNGAEDQPAAAGPHTAAL